METDYISRNAVIERITALINASGKYTAYECGADDACYIVEHEIPAADVLPVVRGTWKVVDYEYAGLRYGHDYVCSKCGCKSDGPWKYCHDCGALMQEVPTDD